MEQISRVVRELEKQNDKDAASDPTIKRSLHVVEEFLKHHPVMCYGGTAINNLLPKNERFYHPETDIPDYDFFSKTPQNHSMMIANQLAAAGIDNVEVKPGMHLGTFKVFANFTGVADVTFLEEELFDKLWAEDVVEEGIHYVSPNFLRMSMYLELSRPRGDVSRWEKVYTRLQLLNKYHPALCPKTEKRVHESISDSQKKEIIEMLKKEPVVLLGATAAEVYMGENWTTPIMILAEEDTIKRLTEGEKVNISPETEILPERTQVIGKNGEHIFQFYKTSACHSFHTMSNGVRVASIPTILQFYFAYSYTNAHPANIASFLCVAQRIVDIAHSSTQKKRFSLLTPKECIGMQVTLTQMKERKSALYKELSQKKDSKEFNEFFFSYNPLTDDKKKTRRRIKSMSK